MERIEDCGDGTSWSCRTSPLFPHGAEGYHATVGDLRLRLGDLDGARAAYARAREMPAYEQWPHRTAFETWMELAAERASSVRTDVPEQGAALFFASGERSCSACHER